MATTTITTTTTRPRKKGAAGGGRTATTTAAAPQPQSPETTTTAVVVIPPPSSPRLEIINQGLLKFLQQHHLLIDLDSTIVHTITNPKEIAKIKHLLNPNTKTRGLTEQMRHELQKRVRLFTMKDHEGGNFEMLTIIRHGAMHFLEFAYYYFRTVSIWSAGQPAYVDTIVSCITPEHLARPGLILNWNDCKKMTRDDGGGGAAASPSTTDTSAFIKPLDHVVCIAGLDRKRIFILDDRDDVFTVADQRNLIQIPKFEPRITIKSLTEHDNALEQLIFWFLKEHVIRSENVQTLEKGDIFSTTQK